MGDGIGRDRTVVAGERAVIHDRLLGNDGYRNHYNVGRKFCAYQIAISAYL